MNRDLLAELVRRKFIWCYYCEYLVYIPIETAG